MLEATLRGGTKSDKQKNVMDVKDTFGYDISQWITHIGADISVDVIDKDLEGIHGQCEILDDRLVEKYVDALA